ncbi:glycosyltransferase family 4 protein [Vibrio gallaecicus]|uniref:Glycosyltransferase family 4 protein n=1 Tax=Vibrio gallaecicus TaxID=552386 RepID=A0ABV4NE22_9VIBR
MNITSHKFTFSKTLSHTPVHSLVYDPIPFAGGSKVATAEMLQSCHHSKTQFTILSADSDSWSKLSEHSNCRILSLPKWKFLTKTQGLGYWFAQLCLLSFILVTMLRVKRIDHAVGASGPGIDMAIYLAGFFSGYSIIQLVHGPVAQSRSIGYCLTKAFKVFYLKSSEQSIENAIYHYFILTNDPIQNQILARFSMDKEQFQPFNNGIAHCNWPSTSSFQSTRVLWAASLLKWKGLGVLLEAINPVHNKQSIETDICYIRPTSTEIGVSSLPENWANVSLYQSPSNLDQIRSQAGIFVSTSIEEPFGLSILEALAAGLSVVIPEDGAYWDKVLTHGINCMKYSPRSATALRDTLNTLTHSSSLRASLAIEAKKIASDYHAEYCYADICQSLSTPKVKTTLGHQPQGKVL